MACRSSASGSTTSRLSRAWCCWVRCVLTFTTNDVEARIDRTRHPRRMNRPIARAGTRVLLFQSVRRRRVPRYVHREIKEKDNQHDNPELNALQCQRRADVSGEGSRSESREFAKPIFAASSIPSLIRVVFCCFSRDSACCMNRYSTLSAALVRTDAWVTLPSEFRRGPMNSRLLLRALACGALMLAAASPVRAEGTFDIPAGARFNQDKLAKVTEFFKNEVATGKIAGANVLIRQRGKEIYHETFGVPDVVSKTPITDQTIFRLSSLTKAITSVVAMQFIQDGKIKLDDPVSKYIPSFANMKVGVEKKAEDGT